ncbi:hypothetical protein [Geodermatophilus sp. URMC 63]
MSRPWTAQEVRARLEEYLLTEGPRLDVELLGTLVSDENHLTVLVRSLDKPITGDLQSINFDLDYLYREVPATTLDSAFNEVLHGSLHYFDIHGIGVDQCKGLHGLGDARRHPRMGERRASLAPSL